MWNKFLTGISILLIGVIIGWFISNKLTNNTKPIDISPIIKQNNDLIRQNDSINLLLQEDKYKIQALHKSIDSLTAVKNNLKRQYHEKINRVDTYTNKQLNSYFTDRYNPSR